MTACSASVQRERVCLASLLTEVADLEERVAGLHGLRADRIARAPRTIDLPAVPQPIDAEAPDEPAALRDRYRDVRSWYRRVAQRVETRLEEQQVLSEAWWTVVTGPGVLFYPVIRWNVRSVLWDGEDPDAETDAVNRFCRSRAARDTEGASGGTVFTVGGTTPRSSGQRRPLRWRRTEEAEGVEGTSLQEDERRRYLRGTTEDPPPGSIKHTPYRMARPPGRSHSAGSP